MSHAAPSKETIYFLKRWRRTEPRGLAGVAKVLKISRTSVSHYLNGHAHKVRKGFAAQLDAAMAERTDLVLMAKADVARAETRKREKEAKQDKEAQRLMAAMPLSPDDLPGRLQAAGRRVCARTLAEGLKPKAAPVPLPSTSEPMSLTVQERGLLVCGTYFNSPALVPFLDQRVIVQVAEGDKGRVYVSDDAGDLLCSAFAQPAEGQPS